MSATNATTYYELPVFVATDKPAWLTDWNGAMNAIDTAIKEALTAGENAQTTANTATTSIATINDSLTTINTSLSTLTSTVTGLVGSVNTINSLIGNGEPTTSDKTLIGAINEIYGMITGGGGGAEIQAQNVVYDNTTSGLTADDVQSAIDEVNSKISTPEADDVTYDNTSSGLTATNVQSAIDELAGSGAGYDFDLTAHTGTATVTMGAGINDSGVYPSDVSYEFNDDYSVGKIYGQVVTGNVSFTGDLTIATIAVPNAPTRSASKKIKTGPINCYDLSTGNWAGWVETYIQFETDGTLTVHADRKSGSSFSGVFSLALPACIYLF